MSIPTRFAEICKLLIAGTKNSTIVWTSMKSNGHTATVGSINFIVKDHGNEEEGLTGIDLRIVNEVGDEIDETSTDIYGPQDLDPMLRELHDLIYKQVENAAMARLKPVLDSLRERVSTRPPER